MSAAAAAAEAEYAAFQSLADAIAPVLSAYTGSAATHHAAARAAEAQPAASRGAMGRAGADLDAGGSGAGGDPSSSPSHARGSAAVSMACARRAAEAHEKLLQLLDSPRRGIVGALIWCVCAPRALARGAVASHRASERERESAGESAREAPAHRARCSACVDESATPATN